MKTETKPFSILFADSARGIYIPQHFAESHAPEHWQGMDPADLAILKTGPEEPHYWDAWTTVLDNAETTDGGKLHQDGDLWVIWPDRAIETVNEYCAAQLDYEENHENAGNNYAHLLAESWSSDTDKRLRDELERHEINARDLSAETLAEITLDIFRMQRGSVHGPYADGVIIGAYPVQEIEIQLDGCGVEGVALEYVQNSCEPYIDDGLERAYLTTDAVWFAIADPQELQAEIDRVSAALA